MACLDRFVSTIASKLDSKGRISIPAPFRNVLARDGFEGLYVHRCLDAEALDCGGNALLREIDALLATFSPYSEEHDLLSTALLGSSELLKVDTEGRVVLPESVKSYAGIVSEAVFVGHGYKFQIWEPNRFRAHLEEAKQKVRDVKKLLSSRHAAGVLPPARPQGARE